MASERPLPAGPSTSSGEPRCAAMASVSVRWGEVVTSLALSIVTQPGSIDWLALCERCASRQAKLFAARPTIDERTEYDGVGDGGDHTLVIDRDCETIVFEELEDAVRVQGTALTAVSEERGEVEIGDGDHAATIVVIDPIDGSLNARRTIPGHSLSIAVASGRSMADVDFGFVHDFGAGESFAAERGRGATLAGRAIALDGPDVGLEVVGLESAKPELVLGAITSLQGEAYRLRVVGSIAITMAYVAAGRFDGMLSARSCRSVDAAAAQLIVREAGGAVAFGELELSEAALDLDVRYPVAAARDAERLGTLRGAQASTGAEI